MTDNINPFDNESPWGGRIPVRFKYSLPRSVGRRSQQGDLVLTELSMNHAAYKQELLTGRLYAPYSYVLGSNFLTYGENGRSTIRHNTRGVLHLDWGKFVPVYTEDEE